MALRTTFTQPAGTHSTQYRHVPKLGYTSREIVATYGCRLDRTDLTTLTPTGHLTEQANPWARRTVSDLSTLERTENGREFLEHLDGAVGRLFCTHDPQLVE